MNGHPTGCRCDADCLERRAKYYLAKHRAKGRQPQKRRSTVPIPGLRHGTVYAYRKGCGCSACRVACAVKERARIARRKAEADFALPKPDPKVCAGCGVSVMTHDLTKTCQ